uniref:thioesterase domain-containing protein n=1 Tax=Burkholderia arboris TaxID=488730 RepID=UPI003BEEC1AB
MNTSWIGGRPRNADTATTRLFCFSHAGGGTALYTPWRNAFGPEVDVCPVLLPGREARMRERAYRRMEDLIDPLVDALMPYLDRPFSLFGHSMGSIVAFEVARRAAGLGRAPRSLLVSGRRAPHLRSPRAPVHGLDDAAFTDAIAELGGTPEEVLRDRGIFQTFAPSLRADFELNERYTPLIGPPLACEIVAFSGDRDPQVTEAELLAWREVTSGPFSHHLLDGNHFYLQASPAPLLARVGAHLRGLPATPTNRPAHDAGRVAAVPGDTARPFAVLGLHHVAIGGPDKARLTNLWVNLLGLPLAERFRSAAENVDEDILIAGAGAGAVEIDLMQPLDPALKPDVTRPALNHIGLAVSDLDAAVAWLAAQGVRFTDGGIRRGAGGARVAFIHPASSAQFPLGGEGVLIELVEALSAATQDARDERVRQPA